MRRLAMKRRNQDTRVCAVADCMEPPFAGLAGYKADHLRQAFDNAPLREHSVNNIGWWVCSRHFQRLEEYTRAMEATTMKLNKHILGEHV